MTCQRCGEREGTEIWSEGGVAFVHGCYERWCRRCVLTAQLAHAREAAATVPELERSLAKEVANG